MPKLSVWMVRASLVHMGVGFLFGAMILFHKGSPIFTWTWRLLNPHLELLIFGWTMQFVMGIAFWILPRFSGEQRYGKTSLGWASLFLLNGGVILTAWASWQTRGELALAGRLFTFSSVILFAVMIWPRVKPLGGQAASRK